jgi:hypothetical protein
MKFFYRFSSLLAIFFLSACGVPGKTTLQPSVVQNTSSMTPSAAQLTTSQAVSSQLNKDLLKNSQYHAPDYDKTVNLIDGKYESSSGVDYLLVELLPEIAMGDLNWDNQEDAALLLAENGGGSGVFVSLIAVTNQNGKPFQAGAALIDDRPKINALTIQAGTIILDATIHSASDAMARPSLPVIETYQLGSAGLSLTRLTSRTPDGQVKSISINSPASGAQVDGSVRIKGSMPIAPFENNLVYRIVDGQGKKVDEGPFQVKADSPGGKATFDKTIIIPPLSSGTSIRLELKEVSMKDGSPQALDSIALVVK